MADKTGDGCTMWFDGTWRSCCDKHDKRYENKRITKFQADILLFRCVAKHSFWMGALMFTGVSLFGHWNYAKAQKNG